MREQDFTQDVKEVFQEIVLMRGGEENAECRTCENWLKLCFRPGEFLCACHTSVVRPS
ncbi:MAG: hypothetical protein KQH63_08080 [Desulfobulbaceae bacterium]|nr:hypothetical protein [Desulfobulbaceae bacterium]